MCGFSFYFLLTFFLFFGFLLLSLTLLLFFFPPPLLFLSRITNRGPEWLRGPVILETFSKLLRQMHLLELRVDLDEVVNLLRKWHKRDICICARI